MSSKGKPSSSTAGEPVVPKVKAACEECRTKKTKCDGTRPTCGRCRRKSISCVYETEPDEFRITALKRRYTELEQSSAENSALIALLRDQSLAGAHEILNRLRNRESAASILAGSGIQTDAEAGQNLVSAVETTNTSEGERTSSSHGSVAGEAAADKDRRSAAGIDKQSIAFLVGEPTGTGPPLDAQITSMPAGPLRSHHGQPLQPRQRGEKRKRVSPPPLRPSLPVAAGGAPIPMTPSTDRSLSMKPRTQDKTWMKRFERVRAAEWEVYYTDDLTFLEILKCYFTWENPVTDFVPEEAFWEGLLNDGSDFCNLTLVHSILAFGAKIYGMFEPERSASAEHFALLEATKAWAWDADATVPANISAGFLVHATYAANGQEKNGTPYLGAAMNLLIDSGLFSPERISQAYPSSDPELSRARAAFAWCIYAFHGHHTLTFKKHPLLSWPPPIGIPEPNRDEDSKEWQPFPSLGPSRPSVISTKNHAKTNLWRIGNNILPLHARYGNTLTSESHWNDAKGLYAELCHWHSTLNPRLGNLHGAPPHVFALYTDYHSCILELMKPFVNSSNPLPTREIHDQAHSISEQSRIQLRLLIHQLDLQFPDLPLSLNLLLKPILCVAKDTLPLLSHADEASDEAFYFNLCINLMRRMATSYPLTYFVVLEIRDMANRQGYTLPIPAQETIVNLERSRRASVHIASSQSASRGLSAEDIEAANLRNLIGETDRLHLERGASSR
ncbi:Nitrogen assimilation transcription factor nirA [Lecanosticta acicola]|uniref:Nitrogen assimilation transcription factor nirA n=1 Tax=Lecanosticta acicola TaxID=111012 RepID=A0AAI8YWR2_9PEZI|nr:Nitrogen assimilation transcription factor nirA [Lecanosticta acicola]